MPKSVFYNQTKELDCRAITFYRSLEFQRSLGILKNFINYFLLKEA